MENFWPKLENEKFETPFMILKTQGEFLEKHTNGILSYEIVKSVFDNSFFPSNKGIRLKFYIHAPLMDNYKFLLIQFNHDAIMPYPSYVRFYTDLDEAILNERNGEKEHEVEDLKNTLKNILGNSETSRVINSLIAQSKEE